MRNNRVNFNKVKKYIMIVIMILPLFIMGTNPQIVSAAEEDLTYTISVKPVENQIDKNATYYDLLVKPGQKQNLTVVVSNTGKEAKKLRVTPTNAVTNQNGVVDYSRQEKDYKYDSNLTHPFTSLVGPEQTVEVAAGETKEVTFELAVPNDPFKGEILGGFLVDVVEGKDDDKDTSSNGVKIVNKFQLVKAVMLRESEEAVSPELVLNDVKPALVSYRTAVTANLQNTEPVMFGGMKVVAEVTEKGKTDVLKTTTREGLEMAPNSNFDFPIMWGNERLKAGDYTLSLVATSGEKTWKFAKNFTISAEESDKINKEAVDLEEEPKPYWLYILIIVLILFALLLIIFLVVRHKKKQKAEELRRKRIKAKKNKKSKQMRQKNQGGGQSKKKKEKI